MHAFNKAWLTGLLLYSFTVYKCMIIFQMQGDKVNKVRGLTIKIFSSFGYFSAKKSFNFSIAERKFFYYKDSQNELRVGKMTNFIFCSLGLIFSVCIFLIDF